MMNEEKLKNETNALDEVKELGHEELEKVAGGHKRHHFRFKDVSKPEKDNNKTRVCF